ncbi:MAG: 1,6-anhydro-N-acetylmuramyl-L-alanine amidase AmpD [Magnetococcales bacterium]|nr:1,6-anhydro-N-acetylmuramyl-L-alanine amidase AmpD [Magnetococcales bacterium]
MDVPWAFGRYAPSPFADTRPPGTAIDLLVVHAISLPPKEFGGPYVEDLFLGRLNPAKHPYFRDVAHLRVSTHFFVDRLGVVTQFVPVHKRAWHAGASNWRGRDTCNDFSVGVELEGAQGVPFEPLQYLRLATIMRTLQLKLPYLCDDHIAGHQEIAPGRKWDPGSGFEWDRFGDVLYRTGPHPTWQPVWD